MENLDVTALRQLLDWRSQGKKALLATVVRTWGFFASACGLDHGALREWGGGGVSVGRVY